MKKTLVELFAGVGGFRVGLNHVELKNDKVIEKGNWECLWANQWEPATKNQEAYDCYIKRFGGLINGNLLLRIKKHMIVILKDLVVIMYQMKIYLV